MPNYIPDRGYNIRLNSLEGRQFFRDTRNGVNFHRGNTNTQNVSEDSRILRYVFTREGWRAVSDIFPKNHKLAEFKYPKRLQRALKIQGEL